MAEGKSGGKKKPTIKVTIKCPGCKKRLIVSSFRKRTNEKVKAEYDVWTEVEVDDQKRLPGMEEPPSGKAKPTPKKKNKKKR